MAVLPRLIRPMLATLRRSLPADQDRYGWEFKWDGVRAIAYVSGGELRLMSRNDKDMAPSYPELAALAGRVDAPVILDGEIVALRAVRPDFGALQSRMHVRRPPARLIEDTPVQLYLFDLLHHGPDSLLGLPYTERRDRLEALGLDADPVRTPPWYRDDAEIVLASSLQHGLEGVVGKPLASRYHPGGRRDWIKVKNIRHQEVIIGGWNQGERGRANTIGSVLLGVYDNGRLRYAGNVGTGSPRRCSRTCCGSWPRWSARPARSARRCRPGMPAARTGWNRSWSARWRSPSGPPTGACGTPAGTGFASTEAPARYTAKP
jgi:bifunctional non-homologous end joining protein LigD